MVWETGVQSQVESYQRLKKQYLMIPCLTLQTSIDFIKENGLTLNKARNRQYPVETLTDSDYADDPELLANTPAQAESLLHSLERAARSIEFYVNTNKTKYMCLRLKGSISTLSGKPLKLVDKFSFLGCNILSAESDVNKLLAKTWNAIDRLSIIWKFYLSNKIKWDFYQAVIVSILLYGHTIWMLTKWIEKARWDLWKKAVICLEKIQEVTPHKTAVVWPSASHLTNYSCKTNKTCRALLEKQGSKH